MQPPSDPVSRVLWVPLAQVEANLPAADWDMTKVANGVLINSVLYASPVAALMSGNVTMEAVFVAWMNLLQPRQCNLAKWSTGYVTEARRQAQQARVTVRTWDKRMNRESKLSVPAIRNASTIYGFILGLLDEPEVTEAEPIMFSRDTADRMIAAINARVAVLEDETTETE